MLYWPVRTRNSLSPSSSRWFRTQDPIDPSIQDNVLIPNNFFEYILSHRMCDQFTFHHEFRIDSAGGQNLSKRHTVFFTSVDPMNRVHRDPVFIDLEAPRLAWHMQKTWKTHQDTVYWVDIQLAQKKGFKFYQIRSNAIIFYDTPSLLYPEGYHDGNWRNHIRESICVTSTSSKDFL